MVEDEKFVHQNQNRIQTYLLGLVEHQYDLGWWLDYLPTTDQTGIQNSLQTFVDELWQAAQLEPSFKGVTTDGWLAARNAFAALNSETQLAECLLHPFLKFKEAVHQWAKLTKAPTEQVTLLTLTQLF